MRPLIGSDGERYDAPFTVLAAPFTARCVNTGAIIYLDKGTRVRQTDAAGKSGHMQAFHNDRWMLLGVP